MDKVKTLSEHWKISLEFPSKTFLFWDLTHASPLLVKTWKGINIPTNTTNPAYFTAFSISNINVNYDVDLILKYKCGTDPSHYSISGWSSPLCFQSQHSGRSISSSCVVAKILLANCSQTDTALDLHSSWKNDTVLYSTWYHPSKPSVQHIPLCTASCVMKSDNTLPRFKCLWLWDDGEALVQKHLNDAGVFYHGSLYTASLLLHKRVIIEPYHLICYRKAH